MFKLSIMAYTGRLFKCVSLDGEATSKLNGWYSIGRIYREGDKDFLGSNIVLEGTLLLHCGVLIPTLNEKGEIITEYPPFYVNESDFEFVERPFKSIHDENKQEH